MDLVEKNTEDGDRHPWEVARFKIILQLFNKYTTFSSLDAFTVLDIGCGDTYIAEEFLKVFPKANYHAVDTAFSDQLISNYNKHFRSLGLNLKLYHDVDELGSIKADFVFLFDVIEHIEEEVTFLSNLNNPDLLGSQVQLFITVPAFNSLFTSHDVFLKHYRRYNNKTLIDVVKRAEYTPLKYGYFFFSLLFPRLLQVMTERIKKNTVDTGIGQWESKGLLDDFIVNVLMIDYKLTKFCVKLGIKFPGLSNYMVCKKSV